MSLIENAIEFALKIHYGVQRKYSAEPYIYHPFRVSQLAQEYYDSTLNKLTLEEFMAVALLHDTVEDGPKNVYLQLINGFGPKIAAAVWDVSNLSQLVEQYKKLKRTERKNIDYTHLAKQDYDIKLLKLCDRLDNIKSLHLAPVGYQKLYYRETQELVTVLIKDGCLKLPGERLVCKIDGILTQIKCGWGV